VSARLLRIDLVEGEILLDVDVVIVDAALRDAFDGEDVGSREVDERSVLEGFAGDAVVLYIASSGDGYSDGCRLVATILSGVI